MVFLKAMLMIFIAEMGDKTQILAMTFALKYKIRDIVLGVAIGSFLNHALAIILGTMLLKVIPLDYLHTLAGILFLFFAFTSLKIENGEEIDERSYNFAPFIAVALAFFLGELGDKTQLTALSLATSEPNPILILLGTTSGMVLTSLVGIFIGIKLGKSIPEDKLKLGAFMMFSIFGVEKIYPMVLKSVGVTGLIAFLGILIIVSTLFIKRYIAWTKGHKESKYLKMAEKLHSLKTMAHISANNMCLGLDNCNICLGSNCLVGYMKLITDSGQMVNSYDEVILLELTKKDYDKSSAKILLYEILEYYDHFEGEYDNNRLLKELRNIMELILFEEELDLNNYKEYKKHFEERING
jgi:putative Ca2+/H+ antiporter (TMEM165/GDT1 family)